MSFPSISALLPKQYPNAIAFVETTEETIAEVAIGIFSAALSYGKETLPSLVFYAIHIVQPSLVAYITHSNTLMNSILPLLSLGGMIGIANAGGLCDNTETALQLIQWLAATAIITELAVGILFPPSLAVHLTVRGIVLFSSAVGNLRTIQLGCMKIHEGLTDQTLKTSEKVSHVVSGLISVGLGTVGSVTTLTTANKLYEGVKVYQKLDETQKFYALKYYGLDSLAEVKPKKAIIINGFSGEWASEGNYYFDNTPDPAAYAIYQNYETHVYEVTSSKDLSKVLDQATKELGGKLDMVCLFGHADNKLMVMNKNYDFKGNQIEVQAIRRNIAKDGEVLLWGCETAKSSWRYDSLTKKISKMLPHNLVTGFSESIYPDQSWAWFDGKLRVSAWDDWSSSDMVKIFKNGTLAAA